MGPTAREGGGGGEQEEKEAFVPFEEVYNPRTVLWKAEGGFWAERWHMTGTNPHKQFAGTVWHCDAGWRLTLQIVTRILALTSSLGQ